MQYIEEITAGLIALATVITTVIAVAGKVKKEVGVLIEDTPEQPAFTAHEKEEITKELTELKMAVDRIRSDISSKCQVHEIQIDHLEKDVATLFEKTDKLTDILIDHFSR